MKETTTLFSVQISEREKQMFKDVSRYRGQTMAGVLRQWIRKAHAMLPEEAKS